MRLDFLAHLRQECCIRGLHAGQWRRSSPNAFELNTQPRQTLLWVHDSSNSPGFWGLSRTFLEAIEVTGSDWYIVFLTSPGEAAYVASSRDVASRREQVWRLAPSDDAYKVHENHEVHGLTHVDGHSAVIGHVLGFIAPAA